MTADGIKGSILNEISDAKRVNEVTPFIPYFKVLFKFCQLGMTLKTKQNLLRKEEAAAKETDDLIAKKKTQSEILANLDFSEDIKAEVDRMRNQEIACIAEKQNMLQMKINEYQIHEDKNASYMKYFQGLN